MTMADGVKELAIAKLANAIERIAAALEERNAGTRARDKFMARIIEQSFGLLLTMEKPKAQPTEEVQ